MIIAITGEHGSGEPFEGALPAPWILDEIIMAPLTEHDDEQKRIPRLLCLVGHRYGRLNTQTD